jgi:Protein tyrosine/serine phosphatase
MGHKKAIICSILLLITFHLSLFGQARPQRWAKPLSATYIENFFQIDDEFFRSGNPSKEAFRELESLGIMEVINLQTYHSDDDEAEGTKVTLHRVKMNAHRITEEDVVEVLRLIKDRKGKILIHCKHGSDRTGLIAAMYRVIFQGWTKEDATDELINGGYGHHRIFRNIPKFIEKADIPRIKEAVMRP